MSDQQAVSNGNGSKGMGLRGAIALGIGSMVGAGIFTLLGQAGAVAGSAVYLSFLLAGVMALFTAYSVAKLGVRFPSRGGLVEFLAQEFGPGMVTGTMSVVYVWAGITLLAMGALTFGSYGASLIFQSSDYPAMAAKTLGILIVLLLSAVNVAGSGLMNKVQSISVVVVVVVLTGVSLVGLTTMDASNLAPSTYPPPSSIIASLALTFFAFTGFAIITNAVEDMKDPKRTLPRAIYISVIATTLLYVLVAIFVYGNLSVDDVIKDAATAVAQAAEPVMGNLGFILVAIAALFATVSTVNSGLFGSINITFALANKGELPAEMGRQTWKGATGGLLFTAIVTIALIAFVDLTAIASVGSAIFMIVFMMVNVGHLRVYKKTGANLIILILATITMLGALIAFLISTYQSQPEVIWLLIVSIFICYLVEVYMRREHQREVKPQIQDEDAQPATDTT